MEKSTIMKAILKYASLVPNEMIKRELSVHSLPFSKAQAILGPRKAGKTFFLFQLIKSSPSTHPIIISFDDAMLDGMKGQDLELVMESAREIHQGKNITYYFDEIQELEGWEKFVLTLVNQRQKVFVSGSNAKLLSKEIHTALRGKSLPYLLLPFSFQEYLRAKNFVINKTDLYTDKVFEIKKHFNEYLTEGGFPEIILTKEKEAKNSIINNYFDSVLYKDLVDRLEIKNTALAQLMLSYVLNLYSNTLSIKKLENYIKSTKTPYSLEDVYKILDALDDVYFTVYVREHSKSFKKTHFSKSKVYIIDTGYISYLSKEPDDKGRLLENFVLIELFRRTKKIENKDIYYHKGKNECDFLVCEKNIPKQAIQVCHEINQKNEEREINGLLEAMEKYGLKKGTILTQDQEKEISKQGKKITVKPVWKWLLEKQ